MIKLLGSTTSPYVRRIRVLLHNQDYQFEQVNVFEENDRKKIAKFSPIVKLPILVDGAKVIWDSMLITEHLLNTPFTIEEKKYLTLINEASDAGILAFQMKKFNVDAELKSTLAQNQISRIQRVLEVFNERCQVDSTSWSVEHIWLYCLLDWMQLREIYDFSHLKELVNFLDLHQDKEVIKATDPRQ